MLVRHVKFTARPGQGDALAALLAEAAAGAREADGCELYVVSRSEAEPDGVWVTELWRDHAAVAASLEADGAREQIARVLPLLAGRPQLVETVALGG